MRNRIFAAAAAATMVGSSLFALAPAAVAAAPAKPYDFNGDGYRDLAIGSPHGKVGTKSAAGFVSVTYGSSSGLNTKKRQVLHQDSKGVPGAAEKNDNFGMALTSADFDEDGYADLIVGVPGEDVGSKANIGGIYVLWGAKSGLTGAMSLYDSTAPAGTRQGLTLTAGDFNGGGYADIGFGGTDSFGWFSGEPGSASNGVGLAAARDGGKVRPRRLALPHRGGEMRTAAAGGSVKIYSGGSITGDGADNLVVTWKGFPGETALERNGVAVMQPEGLNNLVLQSEVAVVADTVAIDDFDGDGFDDVVVGQTSDKARLGGQIVAYPGSADGIAAPQKGIGLSSAGVAGTAKAGDKFGWELSTGDVNNDGKADLAVGAPTIDVGGKADAGRVYLLFGSATGVTGVGSETISQSTANVPGGSEKGDYFGFEVSLLDFTKDGRADLAVGASRENHPSGAITVIKSRGTTGLVPVSGAKAIGPGTFGVTKRNPRFGYRLGG